MPTAQQDTEITLGTGRMLAIFFTFVLVCAFFFAIGFSLGRRTTMAGTIMPSSALAGTGAPSTIVRPSPAKNSAPQSASQSSDFGFYKAVGEKNVDSALTSTSKDAKTQPAPTTVAASTPEAPPNAALDAASTSPGYYVQVAAVSRQEDAASLVEALKKKQYPAFSANNASVDKFYHVQVGPYTDLKEAEAMRGRLISDGYNPIVKK